MLRPGTFGLTLLLSFLTALGPLTMDMYLPSLPAIGQALDASTVQVQLTISSYLIGFAAGQIVYGPMSDRIGRRPVILAALVLYGVATIVSAVAQSIEILIAVRFVQALGGAGCIVLARAAVRDLYSGVRAGRELSLMGSITACCKPRSAGAPASCCWWPSRWSPVRRRRCYCRRRCASARRGLFRLPPWAGSTARCWCIAAFWPMSASWSPPSSACSPGSPARRS
jgi:Major Facilitator Superfamily